MKKMTYTKSLVEVVRSMDMKEQSNQNQQTKAKVEFDAIHSFLQGWNEVNVGEDSTISSKSSYSSFTGQLEASEGGTQL